jgi:hypothetical protein
VSEAAQAKTTAERIAVTAERLSAAFLREMGKVLRDAERAIRPILREALDGSRTHQVRAVRGLRLRKELRDALLKSGYRLLVEAATDAAVDQMATAVTAKGLVKEGVALTRPSPTKLQALADIGKQNLLQVADDVSAALWRSLAQWLYTTRPVDDILDDLSRVFGDELDHLDTLFDTQVSMMGRQIEALSTAGLTDQAFLYMGPADQKTRPFCAKYVGQVMTREFIDALDNEQLPNPFITGGGYNCRHSWIAVESKELRELANTGEKVPEFAAKEAA